MNNKINNREDALTANTFIPSTWILTFESVTNNDTITSRERKKEKKLRRVFDILSVFNVNNFI